MSKKNKANSVIKVSDREIPCICDTCRNKHLTMIHGQYARVVGLQEKRCQLCRLRSVADNEILRENVTTDDASTFLCEVFEMFCLLMDGYEKKFNNEELALKYLLPE